MAGEFNLIKRYFANRQSDRSDVQLALGDDCALLTVPAGQQLAVSTDSAVLGTHFLVDAEPEAIAYKTLMSNISDLAAMGATPAWLSLALTLPEPNEAWLSRFCDAMFALADRHNLQLIGGDTTQGPLSISFTIHGFIPQGQALRRNTAQAGDWIYVSGCLGDSQAGLEVILDQTKAVRPYADCLRQRHFYPLSRIFLAEQLRGLASSCIDISDGLIADLGHICQQSDVHALIDIDSLPLSTECVAFYGNLLGAQKAALISGEEYELCFTVPETHKAQVEQLLNQQGSQITCIGRMQPSSSQVPIQLVYQQQVIEPSDVDWQLHGFDHFQS